MQQYVCGFLFSPERDRVLLIRKNRPAWQAGKLNGIGGKIEPGETPGEAMRREFREEAGLDVPDFRLAVVLSGRPTPADPGGWRGYFFRAFGAVDQAKSLTDEGIEVHRVYPLPPDTIPNLRWMIPLMLDDDHAERRQYDISFG